MSTSISPSGATDIAHVADVDDVGPQAATPKRASRKRLGFFGRMGRRLATVTHLFAHLRQTGRWWLVPMVVVFLAAACLLVVVQVIEYAAPFVYTLF